MAKKDEVKEDVYIAVMSFRDKDNYDKSYYTDQEVTDLSAERISELLGKGLIKKADDK